MEILFNLLRTTVILGAGLLVAALYRLYLERSGKRNVKLESSGPLPAHLVLIYIGAIVYITLDVARNFGHEDFNWFETPLAAVIIFVSVYTFWKQYKTD